MDKAVWHAHDGVMSNMGQCCIAGSRTFVQEEIYDEFVKRSRELAEKRKVGDPYEAGTQNGPQVHLYYSEFCIKITRGHISNCVNKRRLGVSC